jgi:hypothetical protein
MGIKKTHTSYPVEPFTSTLIQTGQRKISADQLWLAEISVLFEHSLTSNVKDFLIFNYS